jgi:hypothetical protein
MPDKSGFPSAVLGAGAVRSSCPAAVLGTRGDGVEGHCAETTGVSKASAAITPTASIKVFTQASTFIVLDGSMYSSDATKASIQRSSRELSVAVNRMEQPGNMK